MQQTLRLIAVTWLRAAAVSAEHLGLATAYTFAALAQQVLPAPLQKETPRRPSWLDEMDEVRGTEGGA